MRHSEHSELPIFHLESRPPGIGQGQGAWPEGSESKIPSPVGKGQICAPDLWPPPAPIRCIWAPLWPCLSSEEARQPRRELERPGLSSATLWVQPGFPLGTQHVRVPIPLLPLWFPRPFPKRYHLQLKRGRETAGRLVIEGEKLGLLEEDHKMQVPQEGPVDCRAGPAGSRGKSRASSLLSSPLDFVGWDCGRQT